ncbi:winged helix-turn-helix domain-containing protein [Devosia sp.]|uniref:ArsR/SmtB family transcription factor n=1 Tax=Devosia sp. TaxID=1871048 RepID=UPI003265841E
MTLLPHPDLDQITLPNVLASLGDETRLAIIGFLARHEDLGMTCNQFCGLASKTNLTYHVGKLREAGVVNVRAEGTRRRVSLRRDDLDSLFPGFFDTVINNALAMPVVANYDASISDDTADLPEF